MAHPKRVFSSLLFHESNTFNPVETTHNDFLKFCGEDALQRMGSTPALRSSGVEVVGGIWAMALSSGPVAVSSFASLKKEIQTELERHDDLDGVVLHLHGSLQVADGSSGDLQIISMFRQILGQEIPIVIAMDPHANLSVELTGQVDGICAYNTIPHIDQEETEARAAALLLQRMAHTARVPPVVIKLPLVIGGDSAIDSMAPMQEIHGEISSAIASKKALDANFFVGFSWSDNPHIGASVLLNPAHPADMERCVELASGIARTVWKNRGEFTYSEKSFNTVEGIRWALTQTEAVVLADTGDNTTGGAPGWGTSILEVLLDHPEFTTSSQRICLGPIRDDTVTQELAQTRPGDSVEFLIGDGSGSDRPQVSVMGKVTAHGSLLGYLGSVEEVVGQTTTVRVGQLDVVIANHPSSFVTEKHFSAAGLDANDYDVVIVKQGYIFPEIKEKWPASAFLLTPGATNQVFTDLPFRRVPQGTYPFEPDLILEPHLLG